LFLYTVLASLGSIVIFADWLTRSRMEEGMVDVIVLTAGLGMFALFLLYVAVCERL
jgi:hypothetical protein